jgi:hypothetical protein
MAWIVPVADTASLADRPIVSTPTAPWTPISAWPEKRFNELKVGDVVTFRYCESAVVAVTKPGRASAWWVTCSPRIVAAWISAS